MTRKPGWQRPPRRDIADAAMAMLEVVPTHEVMMPPSSRGLQIGKAARWEFRAVLGGLEQRLDEGVVVGNARTRVRGLDAQPVEHGQHCGGLQGATVIAMQHGLCRHGMQPLAQRGALDRPCKQHPIHQI